MLVDAMMLVKHVDAIAYVIMSDYARRRYIIKGVEELSNSDAPIVGCILNGGSTRSGGYYGYKYGYGYRYGYKYGYRYGYNSYPKAGNKISKKTNSKKTSEKANQPEKTKEK